MLCNSSFLLYQVNTIHITIFERLAVSLQPHLISSKKIILILWPTNMGSSNKNYHYWIVGLENIKIDFEKCVMNAINYDFPIIRSRNYNINTNQNSNNL